MTKGKVCHGVQKDSDTPIGISSTTTIPGRNRAGNTRHWLESCTEQRASCATQWLLRCATAYNYWTTFFRQWGSLLTSSFTQLLVSGKFAGKLHEPTPFSSSNHPALTNCFSLPAPLHLPAHTALRKHFTNWRGVTGNNKHAFHPNSKGIYIQYQNVFISSN